MPPYAPMMPPHMAPGGMIMPPPPPHMMQHHQQLPPRFAMPPPLQPLGAPQVISSAPVLYSAPPTVGGPLPLAPLGLPPPPIPSATAISANHMSTFNASNNACVFINATSDHLNRTIFGNAHAGLPLTLYCGNVPLDFEDLRLLKVSISFVTLMFCVALGGLHFKLCLLFHQVFEYCGKVAKFVRPTDPVTLLPTVMKLMASKLCLYGARA